MNANVPDRGAQLAARGKRQGRWLGSGLGRGLAPRWLARAMAGLVAAFMHRVLDRMSGRLLRGAIHARLPDGSTRMLGGKDHGFAVEVKLYEWRALRRLMLSGSVGWYEAWEAEEWSSPDPVALFALFMDNSASLAGTARSAGPWRWAGRLGHWLRRNTRAGSARNIHAHYDLGNDFYAAWLDPSMSYSSGLYSGLAGDLAAAQEAKMAAMAARVAGARSVLEIGCGWGAMAAALSAAGHDVTAISISSAQLAWAGEHHPGVSFRQQDYRDVTEQYDAIVSVEMVEAVGADYWPAFLDSVARCLKPGGRAGIQFICLRDDLWDAYAASADFIQTHVFPGGMLLRESAFRALAEARGLAWNDARHFGGDYAETLLEWRRRFDLAIEQGRLPAGFDARFVRLWRFYLMYCEGGFRGGGIDVVQVTLVKAV